MNTPTNISLEEYDKLKKECNLLQLHMKELKARHKSIRDAYNNAMHRYNVGVGAKKANANHCVALTTYARKRCMDAALLRKKLKEANILFVERHISYLTNPGKYGNLVIYKTHTVNKNSTLECMYWTPEGVAFLDEFVKTHYQKQPKQEFTF
jgi:hypothetical protein